MDELQPVPQETTQPAGRATQPNESELVAQVLRKDRKATAVFVGLYADQIYGYVQRRLIPHADHVDDLVQEIFLAAWENLSKFRGESSLQNWILGIARHKVENHYRHRLREVQFSSEEEKDLELYTVDAWGLAEAFDLRERTELVREVLANIPEPYSVVLLWRYWEKRSVREIAVATGKTEKAIERLLARARNQFKRKWNERHVFSR
jgi:RNA polymerase sigma-70 factor (ECF subfamily)